MEMAAGKMSGGLSGGTFDSMLNIVDEIKKNPSLRRVLGNPYALNPEGIRGPDKGDQTGVHFDKDLNMWTAPFLMAAINTRIVRRSHALLGLPWGEDFRYSEVMSTGKGPKGFSRAVTFTGGIVAFMAALALPLTRQLVVKRLPSPGEGPSEEVRAKGYFNTLFVALGDGESVHGLVADQRDYGYGSTAVMLSESALCLALDGAQLQSEGGIRTPASTMGTRLVERLRAAGMTFQVQS